MTSSSKDLENPVLTAIIKMGPANKLSDNEVYKILEEAYQQARKYYPENFFESVLIEKVNNKTPILYAIENNNLAAVKWLTKRRVIRWSSEGGLLPALEQSIQYKDDNTETKDESIQNKRNIIIFLLQNINELKSDIASHASDFGFPDVARRIINREYKKYLDLYGKCGMRALQNQNYYFFDQLWKFITHQEDVYTYEDYSPVTGKAEYGTNFLRHCLIESAQHEPLDRVVKSIEVLSQYTLSNPTSLVLTYLLTFGAIDSADRFLAEALKNPVFKKLVKIDEIFKIHNERNLTTSLYPAIKYTVDYQVSMNTIEDEKILPASSLFSFLIPYCSRNKNCEEDGIKIMKMLLNNHIVPQAKDLDQIFSYSNPHVVELFKDQILKLERNQTNDMPHLIANIWRFPDLANKLIQSQALFLARPNLLKNIWKCPDLVSNLLESKLLPATVEVGKEPVVLLENKQSELLSTTGKVGLDPYNTWLHTALVSYTESNDISLKPKLIEFIKILSKWKVRIQPTDLEYLTLSINDFDILSTLIATDSAKNLLNDKATIKRNKYLENIVKQGNMPCISCLLESISRQTNVDLAFEAALIKGNLAAIKRLLFHTQGYFPENILQKLKKMTERKQKVMLLKGEYTAVSIIQSESPERFSYMNRLVIIEEFLTAVNYIQKNNVKSLEKIMQKSSSNDLPIMLNDLSEDDKRDLYILFSLSLEEKSYPIEGMETETKGPTKKQKKEIEIQKERVNVARMILGNEVVKSAIDQGMKPSYQLSIAVLPLPSAPPPEGSVLHPEEKVPAQTIASAPDIHHEDAPVIETQSEPSAPDLIEVKFHIDDILDDQKINETQQEPVAIENKGESLEQDLEPGLTEETKDIKGEIDLIASQSDEELEETAKLVSKEVEPGMQEARPSAHSIFSTAEQQKQKAETEVDTKLSELLKYKDVLKNREGGPQLLTLLEQMMKIENKQEVKVEQPVEDPKTQSKQKAKMTKSESSSPRKKNIIL